MLASVEHDALWRHIKSFWLSGQNANGLYWQIKNDDLQFSKTQAESAAVLLESDVGQMFTLACTGAMEALSAVQ